MRTNKLFGSLQCLFEKRSTFVVVKEKYLSNVGIKYNNYNLNKSCIVSVFMPIEPNLIVIKKYLLLLDLYLERRWYIDISTTECLNLQLSTILNNI